jgi:Fe-S-cluster containining protein
VSDLPWYADGLAFACTRCGNCCTGAPGSVKVSEAECAELATLVGLDLADFCERFTRLLEDGTVSLTERANGDCVFWSARDGCLVYAARPRQCRTWPFWRRNLASREAWAAAASGCPGIDRGARHSLSEIERACADDGTRGLPAAE